MRIELETVALDELEFIIGSLRHFSIPGLEVTGEQTEIGRKSSANLKGRLGMSRGGEHGDAGQGAVAEVA